MMQSKSLLLAGAALALSLAVVQPVRAETGEQMAQAAPGGAEKEQPAKKPGEQKPGEHKPGAPAHPAPPAKQAPPKPAQAPPPHQPAQVAPPAPPAAAPHQPSPAAPQQKPAQAPAPQKPTQAAPPQHRPAEAPPPRRPEHRPAEAVPQHRPAETKPTAPSPEHRPAQTTPPAPQQTPAQAAPPAPAAQQPKPAQTTAPAAQPQKPAQATPPAPTAQQPKPAQTTAPAAQPQKPAEAAPLSVPAAAAPPPPQKPSDASQFIRKPGEAPTRTIQDLRRERQQTREGNTTIIREGNRTIVREGNRAIIRHSEADRFAVGARDVHTEHRNNETVTIIVRPNGDRIITTNDPQGRLLRRVRREANGREIVIIDESGIPRRDDYYVEVPPPRVRLPASRYYVELDRAPPERIYETLIAPPLEPVEHIYSMGQVRYSAPLRMRMPRVDLDINFDTGSWQITPDQISKLDVIARGLNRAIERNPREVFLIEGHTDAVGSDEDNLSLSDRRAEAVAVALTQEFGVPPENLVTQGYGEQEMKVPTGGPSRENRRVAVRRITPLIDRVAAK